MAQITNASSLASLPSPLLPAPDTEVFTKTQLDTLFSILEVTVPSVVAGSNVSQAQLESAVSRIRPYLPESASDKLARAYLSEDIVANPAFREAVVRKFKLYVPPADAQGLAVIFSALNTTVGSYILTGYSAPIHTQDLATRTRIVNGWSTARLPLFRAIYRSLNGLARLTWSTTSSTLPQVLDFPTVPRNIERNDSYDFVFHDFTSPDTPTSLSTDVIIIGSGCGAGVVASHLSRAGLKCLILEKSYHFPSAHFPMGAVEAGEHLMENGGMIAADDNNLVVLAGSNLGGGGTVNWSASLQPQYAVRKEWSDGGLPHFLSPEFQDCLDTVCHRMGVSSSTDPSSLAKIEHNVANKTLLEGARRLGMSVEIVPQNTASKRHDCGYCSYGCPSTTKQGPVNCWLPDAAKHGAEFIEGAFVEEITFSQQGNRKVANGVKVLWTSRDRRTTRTLHISAERVVLAAGTLNSPLVLLRSGLKNPNIGANLHLHATAQVWSVWPNRTNPWEGSILTVAVTEHQNQDGANHGPKIETIFSPPPFGLLVIPSRTGSANHSKEGPSGDVFSPAIEYRVNAAKYGFSTGFISITRDADPGRVYIDPKDPERKRPRIAYVPSARDRGHILEGQIAAARICFVMGAVEIDTGHAYVPRWVRPSSLSSSQHEGGGGVATEQDLGRGEEDEEEAKAKEKERDEKSFTAWLEVVRATGLTVPDPYMLGSAHQMGTCRMSSSPKTGVVDAHGKVWGVDGGSLYVADASVFPSASGVNPMVTNMGIAEYISRGIVREVMAGRKKKQTTQNEQRREQRPTKL
ncbi:hypothetical protein PV08_03535 [Exophiala spinifera]|uniref:Uncharacterized protein n=1 Tax=Exophiala spinifera TaxID=91928 RepID=A0A0D1YVC6_9EURO|nr:uncharacterized protein PV08_03535 [Exophiala spinifera]KIW19241.1 hypothetical protein PV08_03535 [Exophiala spinifera]